VTRPRDSMPVELLALLQWLDEIRINAYKFCYNHVFQSVICFSDKGVVSNVFRNLMIEKKHVIRSVAQLG
jgi:hypothetical protein